MGDLVNNSKTTSTDNPANHKLEPIGYTVEKKSIADKFQSLFLADSISSIKSHIFKKVIVPNLIRFIADTAHASVDAFFYKRDGQNPLGGYSSWTSGSSFINNYSSMFNNPVINNNPNDIMQYKYLGWPTKEHADTALVKLRGEIVTYGATSINTYMSLMGRTGPITGWNYGWKNLDAAQPYCSGGAWYISFPEPVKIR